MSLFIKKLLSMEGNGCCSLCVFIIMAIGSFTGASGASYSNHTNKFSVPGFGGTSKDLKIPESLEQRSYRNSKCVKVN